MLTTIATTVLVLAAVNAVIVLGVWRSGALNGRAEVTPAHAQRVVADAVQTERVKEEGAA